MHGAEACRRCVVTLVCSSPIASLVGFGEGQWNRGP